MQSANDNDEPLEPHAGVHAHADEVDDEDIPAGPAEPEELRRKNIAKQHAHPPVPPVRTEDTVPKRQPLLSLPPLPGPQKFRTQHPTNQSPRQTNHPPPF